MNQGFRPEIGEVRTADATKSRSFCSRRRQTRTSVRTRSQPT
jgi:hypothetical protein